MKKTMWWLHQTYGRLLKEVEYYKQEVEENEQKLAEMKANNRDPYDIKKFEEVLGESYMMIPDSRARLQQTLQDLADYLESNEVTEEYHSNEWYHQAKELLLEQQQQQQRPAQEDTSDEIVETKVDDLQDGEGF